jgi:hypothetical protein
MLDLNNYMFDKNNILIGEFRKSIFQNYLVGTPDTFSDSAWSYGLRQVIWRPSEVRRTRKSCYLVGLSLLLFIEHLITFDEIYFSVIVLVVTLC